VLEEFPQGWRSTRAVSLAVGKQQRKFEALLRDIRQMPLFHRGILVFLMEREGQEFAADSLAYSLGIEPGTLRRTPPLVLINQGLIQRPPKSGRYSPFRYSSSVRPMLRKQFPDLDIEKLVGQLLGVVPEGKL
jgi:hypothetical protein